MRKLWEAALSQLQATGEHRATHGVKPIYLLSSL